MPIFSFLPLLMWSILLNYLGQIHNRYTIVPRPTQLTPRAEESVGSRDPTTPRPRYVRIIARNVGAVPAGLRNPGKAARLALDKLEVRYVLETK